MTRDEQTFWDACVVSLARVVVDETVAVFGERRVSRVPLSPADIVTRADALLAARRARQTVSAAA